MVVTPVEPIQFVAQRSPWGRFGSVLYTFNRLRRMRRCFQLRYIYEDASQVRSIWQKLPKNWLQLSVEPQAHAHAA